MEKSTEITKEENIGPSTMDEEDPEITDDVKDALTKWKDDLPYNKRRYIMIVLFIVLIMLVVFLGVAYGGMKVCSDLDGVLDSKFKCHPNYYTQQRQSVDAIGQPFIIPSLPIENGSR